MARIGLLSISDGRDYVHRDVTEHVARAADDLAGMLREAGHEVIVAPEQVSSNALATSQARWLADQHVDLTVFHHSVWTFPHFTMLAAEATPTPLLLVANIDPQYPGMVGMLAGGGGLDQIGRVHARAWGDLSDPAVRDRILTEVRAAGAVQGLRGATFGRIGGRPMGMYTAVANTDQWMKQFGVDVEEIDQWEIVRRAENADAARVAAARDWLEKHAAGVHYDGDRLTPELLERQIRTYYAMRELIEEWRLDFSGIKGQPELTANFCTMDLAEAFLNDPYDWEGPKETHVTATEADMDGALTMQILKLLSGDPVLFADVRHYHADRDIWDLCNSGQHATWYAARSDDPAENLSRVNFYPEVFYFPAGGASVQHLAAPGEMTFARLTRENGAYRMHVMRGATETYDDATNDRLMRASTFEWPHAFARLDAPAGEFLGRFGSNHIHAVPGDYVAELRAVCRYLGIRYDGFGSAA
ncbi:L-fucose/L-arabinose isomerase family protein [Streptomyces sp. 7-21]|jgi:L-fucose isomerase|uniref:L-fucose/L-arabinose isomerase family protein n=1 Tax=Streptomyces sp. 7-21 TaxID=2802283 RepID=UPI00191CA806|nr:L-fucose/L-arabinose isomerase family protein [Streptomyces sp. 7-21]MBL1068606.1 L-fucose/L-arabinose isomerase family protein [Streptomyces sp. 7-21]